VSFADITGNSRVRNILKKGLKKERLPNSLLLCGPDGVGKRETAFVLAKALNCLTKHDDSCEECANCRAIQKGNFPDVLVLFPKNDVIKIDEIRDLKKTVCLKPMIGRKRVFILIDSEKMTEPASHSLLKILEEPPLFSHILLTSRNPHLILSTIRSRCQILTFSPILRKDIHEKLIQEGCDQQKAGLISVLVRGNLKKAMNLDWDEVQSQRKLAWDFFVALSRGNNAAGVLKELTSSRKKFKEVLGQTLELLFTLMRDFLLIKSNGAQRMLLNPDYADKIEELTRELEIEDAMTHLKRLETAFYSFQKRVNPNLIVCSLFTE